MRDERLCLTDIVEAVHAYFAVRWPIVWVTAKLRKDSSLSHPHCFNTCRDRSLPSLLIAPCVGGTRDKTNCSL
jgi:hypothetical protein